MARSRGASVQLEAGSDSFLDIVANIVGILIILIVIAGVRMTQAPLRLQPQEPSIAEPVLIAVPAPVVHQPVLAEPVPIEQSPQEQIVAALGSAQSFPTGANHQSEMISKTDPQLTALLAQLDAADRENNQLLLDVSQIQQQTTAFKSDLDTALLSSNASQKEIQSVNQGISLARQQMTSLEGQLRQLSSGSEKTRKQLEHQIVPVSSQVKGEEWHFELRDGKVSFVPISELLDQVKSRVEQRLPWIARYGDYEAMIGPIAGYSVRFVAGKQDQSLADEVAFGQSQVRIILKKWELIPEQGIAWETAEQASQTNSHFRTELQRISRKDTITFWVYQDSFPLYGSLNKIAQQDGYRVAARPMPLGKLIGGSPQGSRSVSQ